MDDDLAHAAILDANFEENRGGCLYLLLILHHGAPGHYFEGIPEELEDAAKIDGCSEWKTLLKIVLPVSKPALASIGLFYAVWHWNSFFDVVLYITKRELWPLQTLLREVVLTMSMAELNASMADLATPPSSSVIAATVMVSTIPILVVYPFLQKYFVKGVMIGAVKG